MKIGVCLGCFNGESFIKEQIESILEQLSLMDILVITDDNSSDETVSIINNFCDARIFLIRNIEHVGYVKNFEIGLSYLIDNKEVDIIFLSDQDDVWELNKVNKVVKVFNEDPNISFVSHKLNYVNCSLVPLTMTVPREYKYNKLFLFRSFVKPCTFGCGIALRNDVLRNALPFPRLVYTHDHWIELVGYFSGRCVRLDERLIKYRRLTSSLTEDAKLNNSGNKINTLLDKLLTRLKYCSMIFIALYRSIYSKQSKC